MKGCKNKGDENPNDKVEKQSARNDAVNLAIEQIQKQFGRGSIMRLGEKPAPHPDDVIKTGILPLTWLLVSEEFQRENYGNLRSRSSVKTTVCLSIIAEVQKAGGIAAFVDVEHALDPVWAEILGVKLNDLLISQPDTGEQALEIVKPYSVRWRIS